MCRLDRHGDGGCGDDNNGADDGWYSYLHLADPLSAVCPYVLQ